MLRYVYRQECESTMDSLVPTQVCLGPSELLLGNPLKSIDMQLKLDAPLPSEGFARCISERSVWSLKYRWHLSVSTQVI